MGRQPKSADATPAPGKPKTVAEVLAHGTDEEVAAVVTRAADYSTLDSEVLAELLRSALQRFEAGQRDQALSPQEREGNRRAWELVQKGLDREFASLERGELQSRIRLSIRYAMEATRITQAELARRSGLNPSVLNRLLSGKQAITTYQLMRIASGLDAGPEGLIDPAFTNKTIRRGLENAYKFAEATRQKEQRLHEAIDELFVQMRQLQEKAEGSGDLSELEAALPSSLVDFLKANHHRITPSERALLVAAGKTMTATGRDARSAEYWLEMVRNQRRLEAWPSEPSNKS